MSETWTVIIDQLGVPIVLAPMAGGPSTPELTAAVAEAGGFGQLAAGYLSADDTAARIAATRAATAEPFGVNLFVPGPETPAADLADYLTELGADHELGTRSSTPTTGTPSWTCSSPIRSRPSRSPSAARPPRRSPGRMPPAPRCG